MKNVSGILHEFLEAILEILIASGAVGGRPFRGRGLLHGGGASAQGGSLHLLPRLRRRVFLRPLEREVDFPVAADVEHPHLHRLSYLHVVVHIADEAVGHLGDMYQPAFSFRQGDKCAEFGDPGHPAFHNASNFKSHSVSSLSASSWVK